MIHSTTYCIKHPALKPYIQYILFNRSNKKGSSVTSFSNSNICLGILKESILEKDTEGVLTNNQSSKISAYVSGMYLEPHRFVTQSVLDEICIDFSPLGFYHFFQFPIKQYILGEEILKESFGNGAQFIFEKVFKYSDPEKRGRAIEAILLKKLSGFSHSFSISSYRTLEVHQNQSIKNTAVQLNCSERKLQRNFLRYFDITPKQFLRINRFRSCLKAIKDKNDGRNLTYIAYENGFNDQSHLVKEIHKFTGFNPSELRKILHSIDNQVLVAV